ncbi:MAG: ATP-dependent DNA helicase, partial [Planctomycetaceae bacterium]
MTHSSAEFLSETGRVAARLERYERRPEQLEMAAVVEAAVAEGGHLLVEAGTGVGKSFAYLVPAILAAAQRKSGEDRRRVIISTQTISLQEQLIGRDIPFLNAMLPVEFSAVLVKGRSNYMSLRRMHGAVARSASLFSEPNEFDQLASIQRWASRTTDGSRNDLEFEPLHAVWDEVQSEHGNCLGRRCPTYEQCFYYQTRRRAWNADLLVVNHALFFADLALRREGACVLPDYHVVVFDEAHTLEAVAGQHLGLTVSSGQFEFLLGKLYNDRVQRGLLIHHGLIDCQQQSLAARLAMRDFFARLGRWQQTTGAENGRIRSRPRITNDLSPRMAALGKAIA